MKIFGRDPALILGLIVAVLQALFGVFVHVSPGVETAIIAATSAAWGLTVAVIVHDGQVTAILGFAKAGLALALGLGIHLDATQQGLIMSVVTMAVSVVARTQVTAPQLDPVASPLAKLAGPEVVVPTAAKTAGTTAA